MVGSHSDQSASAHPEPREPIALPVQVVTTPPPAAPPRKVGAPKWEVDARARLRTGIQKFTKPLADLAARDANEGDTRLLVTDFLCEALGYDKYSDLTTEYQVKGEFADYGIRIDNDMVAFIEVKRVKTTLGSRHLRQVEMYAVNEGVEWTILTNGSTWQVYHIGAGLPVQIDLTMDVDLLGPGTPLHKSNELFFLTKESIRRKQIYDLWQAKAATSAKSLASILTSPAVLETVRRELRKKTGHRATDGELATILRDGVIRSELL